MINTTIDKPKINTTIDKPKSGILMMLHIQIAVATAALSVLTFMTGCANKSTSQVMVAPNAPTGYTGVIYTGVAPLVDNDETVKTLASTLPSLVYFDFDSDEIKPQAAAILDEQAQFLTTNQTARVLVAGHTDERGSREYNMSLGERRAVAVRNYLLAKGINQASVEIISFGEERPIASGANEEAWSQNRRAELSY